jgi:hypothetical protein
MAQSILAGALQGDSVSAGFIQSYSKETMLCPEMLPVPDATHKRQVRFTQFGKGYYILLRNIELQDIWNLTHNVLLLLLLIAARYAQPEALALVKIKDVGTFLCRNNGIYLNHEVNSLFTYIDLRILSKFHSQNFFGLSLLQLRSPAKSAFENGVLRRMYKSKKGEEKVSGENCS